MCGGSGVSMQMVGYAAGEQHWVKHPCAACSGTGRQGPAGILGVYAALLDQAADQVVVVDPPHSHRQGPIFLNVLQVLDIPVALGLLAPTPLVLVDASDKVFDRVEQIFQLAGASAHCQRK
jgi:hypothetical protein